MTSSALARLVAGCLVLLATAGILARSSDPDDVAVARSIYQRVERRFAGTAAATAAKRAIWRSDHLSLGLVAPDFITHDHAGNEIRLSDFRGDKPVALVFGSFT